jgi:hypothetical protein
MKLEELEKQVEEKCAELKTKLGCDVHGYIITIKKETETEEGDYAVGYIKEPARAIKMKAFDEIFNGSTSRASSFLLTSCLIKEESDDRISDNKSENDTLYMTFIYYANELMKFYGDVLKKN